MILTINGKVIPDSKPPITFKLSYAINPTDAASQHSLIVSNLPSEFTDAQLFALFGKKFYSCRSAKVFKNDDGSSKGTGIVRFADVNEQKQALRELAGWKIQSRPLHIRIAYPRAILNRMMARRPYDPEQHYRQNAQYYNSPSWQMYDYPVAKEPVAGPAYQPYSMDDDDEDDAGDELELYDPYATLEHENEAAMTTSEEFYR